jgi:hypothetical protein
MPNQKTDVRRYQARKASRSAADTRIATLIATMIERANAITKAHGDRVLALLPRADYDRLYDAWEADQEAPADLAAIMSADQELCRLRKEQDHLLWVLFCTRRSGIPSEHYVYSQTGGKLRGPNGER